MMGEYDEEEESAMFAMLESLVAEFGGAGLKLMNMSSII
jgi:hypothetical protein